MATCRDGDDVGAAGLRNSAKVVERQRHNHGFMRLARPRRGGSRSGSTWLDSDRHLRQGQASGGCRAVPARSVRPLRRIGSTGVRSADEICPGKLWNFAAMSSPAPPSAVSCRTRLRGRPAASRVATAIATYALPAPLLDQGPQRLRGQGRAVGTSVLGDCHIFRMTA